MRIGIDYRFLTAGVLTVNRGMGRFTQQQLRETLAIDDHNEYVLFCLPGADRNLILPSIRKARNVSIAEIGLSASRRQAMASLKVDTGSLLRHAEEYQEWIERQRVDLYHATTPFLWHDIPLLDFNVCPYVSTYYDAIPVLYAPHYVAPDSVLVDRMHFASRVTRRSDRLIAISTSARNDAMQVLGYPRDRIDIAHPIADPWFRLHTEGERTEALGRLRRRLDLGDTYVMCVPHLHFSKNLDNIASGYALLPADLRRRMPLVIVCHLSDVEVRLVRDLTDRLGITDQVRLTGFVSEDELAALYGQATVFLHASRYEGFGLPALEAMHCGAAIVASNTSSLPEVVGDAAVLVDSNLPESIAEGLRRVAEDGALRAQLRERGVTQAKKFTGEQLGRATLAAYTGAVSGKASVVRRRLALWTPLPPLATGAGDYAGELLEQLSQTCDVEVFVDDGYLPDAAMRSPGSVQHASAFSRRQRQAPFDAILYQVGASEYHWYMYGPLKQWPGIVTLHDLTWSHVHYARLARLNDYHGLHKLIARLEGPEAAREFEPILRMAPEQRADAAKSFFDTHYLLGDIVQESRAIIVPTEELGREVTERYHPRAPVLTVEMGVTDPTSDAPAWEKDVLRLEAGLDPEAFVVGVFGSVFPIKRLSQIYQAFSDLLKANPKARLLVVGDGPASHLADLHHLAERLGIASAIVQVGHVPVADPKDRERFHRLLQICDVVVNLRWPSHKQMSGTLARAIAAGKPIIITDLPEWRYLPGSFCTRIPAGESEAARLAETLLDMAAHESIVATQSSAARAYFEQHATLPGMAARYIDIVETVQHSNLVSHPGPHHAAHSGACQPVWDDLTNRPLGPDDFKHPAIRGAWRALGLPLGDRSEDGTYVPTRLKSVDLMQALAWTALQALGAAADGRVRRVLILEAKGSALAFALTNMPAEVTALSDYLGQDRRYGRMLAYPKAWAPGVCDLTRLHVRQGDLRTVVLPDAHFDAVVSLQPLNAFAEPAEFADLFQEIRRILTPGGLLLVPAQVSTLIAPGQETEAQGLNLLGVDDVTASLIRAGFEPTTRPSPGAATATASVGPVLDFEAEEATSLEIAVDTPVAITRGVVNTIAVVACRAVASSSDRISSVPGHFQSGRKRRATWPADRLLVGGPGVRQPNSVISAGTLGVSGVKGSLTGHVQARLEAFNKIRMRGWNDGFLSRLPAVVGMAVRGILRLVYLGDTLQIQAEILDDLVRTAAMSERRMNHLAAGWQQAMEAAAERGSGVEGISLRRATADDYERRLEALQGQIDALTLHQAQVQRMSREANASPDTDQLSGLASGPGQGET